MNQPVPAFWLPKLQCTILSGKCLPGEPGESLYKSAYSHWKEIWTAVLSDVNALSFYNVDNFYRQDFMIVLHVDNDIKGMFLSHVFDAKHLSTQDHHYFKPYSLDVMVPLYRKGGLLFSGEYLSASPDARKIFDGFSMTDVLIGVLLEAFKATGATATFGTTIKAAGSHVPGQRMGYSVVGTTEKCGLECLLCLNTQDTVQDHPDPKANALIKKLWKNANIQSSALNFLLSQKTSTNRKAA